MAVIGNSYVGADPFELQRQKAAQDVLQGVVTQGVNGAFGLGQQKMANDSAMALKNKQAEIDSENKAYDQLIKSIETVGPANYFKDPVRGPLAFDALVNGMMRRGINYDSAKAYVTAYAHGPVTQGQLETSALNRFGGDPVPKEYSGTPYVTEMVGPSDMPVFDPVKNPPQAKLPTPVSSTPPAKSAPPATSEQKLTPPPEDKISFDVLASNFIKFIPYQRSLTNKTEPPKYAVKNPVTGQVEYYPDEATALNAFTNILKTVEGAIPAAERAAQRYRQTSVGEVKDHQIVRVPIRARGTGSPSMTPEQLAAHERKTGDVHVPALIGIKEGVVNANAMEHGGEEIVRQLNQQFPVLAGGGKVIEAGFVEQQPSMWDSITKSILGAGAGKLGQMAGSAIGNAILPGIGGWVGGAIGGGLGGSAAGNVGSSKPQMFKPQVYAQGTNGTVDETDPAVLAEIVRREQERQAALDARLANPPENVPESALPSLPIGNDMGESMSDARARAETEFRALQGRQMQVPEPSVLNAEDVRYEQNKAANEALATVGEAMPAGQESMADAHFKEADPAGYAAYKERQAAREAAKVDAMAKRELKLNPEEKAQAAVTKIAETTAPKIEKAVEAANVAYQSGQQKKGNAYYANALAQEEIAVKRAILHPDVAAHYQKLEDNWMNLVKDAPDSTLSAFGMTDILDQRNKVREQQIKIDTLQAQKDEAKAAGLRFDQEVALKKEDQRLREEEIKVDRLYKAAMGEHYKNLTPSNEEKRLTIQRAAADSLIQNSGVSKLVGTNGQINTDSFKKLDAQYGGNLSKAIAIQAMIATGKRITGTYTGYVFTDEGKKFLSWWIQQPSIMAKTFNFDAPETQQAALTASNNLNTVGTDAYNQLMAQLGG